jgi:penicillin-binding protein 1A
MSLLARAKRAALGFDAWLNATLYGSGRSLGEAYEAYAARVDRLAMRGGKRVVFDLASEATSLGLAGAVVLLMLALPAFQETRENWLKQQDLAITFLDRYGQEIGRRGIRHDDSVKLEEFPDYLIKAALATEDRRFYDHWGIDPIGTFRALTVNAAGGGVVQGGSSLTQQLAKNLFCRTSARSSARSRRPSSRSGSSSTSRRTRSSSSISTAPIWAGGAFGAAAATEYYFGKSVKELTLAESAMLAGLFKAPTKYAPHINLPGGRARANDVLSNMVEAGFLTEGQIQTARRNPATPIDRKRDVTPDYYLDWAFERVKVLAADGKLGTDRVLVVKTPLDVGLQRRAEQALESILRQNGKQYDVESAAMVVMDVDGAVRAIVGGRDYGQSQFNRATDALRQPGSSFKPFVYAAALTELPRLGPSTIVTDTGVCIGNWCPANYNARSPARCR